MQSIELEGRSTTVDQSDCSTGSDTSIIVSKSLIPVQCQNRVSGYWNLDMSFTYSNDAFVFLTSNCLKFVGFRMASTPTQQRRKNIILTISTVGAIALTFVVVLDLLNSWGNIDDCLYISCTLLTACLALFKMAILLWHRQEFFELVEHLQQKFFKGNYDHYEETILKNYKRVSLFFVCCFTSFAHGTIINYALNPIIANIGKTESDRVLPFKVWADWATVTPYFEITFVLEVVLIIFSMHYCGQLLYQDPVNESKTRYHIQQKFTNLLFTFLYTPFAFFRTYILQVCIVQGYVLFIFYSQIIFMYQIGLFYFSYDCLLFTINMNVAGQFRILQYRLATLNRASSKENSGKSSSKKYYTTFKDCVRQHQTLIAYCKKLGKVFSVFALLQVLMFSVLICLVGYQILMADAPTVRRFIFICHIGGSLLQLFMFSYGCDCLIRESEAIATAMYSAPWTHLRMNKNGEMLRKDSIMVIMRSNTPCSLSACGFSSISLETYTKVLSTAVSYFALLKQRTME